MTDQEDVRHAHPQNRLLELCVCLLLLCWMVATSGATTLPYLSNLTDVEIVFAGEIVTQTHQVSGFVRNATLRYTACQFSTNYLEYALSFNHTDDYLANDEPIENATVIFDNCKFDLAVAVRIERAVVVKLNIEFTNCSFAEDGGDSTVLFAIRTLEGVLAMSDFLLTDIHVSMCATNLSSLSPIIALSASSALISMTGVSFFAEDAFLDPQFDILNADANIVNVTLLRVTMFCTHLLGTSAGCNNITITAVNSSITEVWDTMILVRAGNHQHFHFHNSILNLSRVREFPEAGMLFEFAPIPSFGCQPMAEQRLTCEGWGLAVGNQKNCSYSIPGYPCSGHSNRTCGGDRCVSTTDFNTTVTGQVTLSPGEGGAVTLLRNVLNMTHFGNECTLERLRLYIAQNETDVLRVGPRTLMANILLAQCNASQACSLVQVRSGQCPSCLSSPFVSWNEGVTGDGEAFEVVNGSSFAAAGVYGGLLTVLAEPADAPTFFTDATIVLQLELSCFGACLAPCSSRDDIRFRFTGATQVIVEDADNTERLLTSIHGASNVQITFGEDDISHTGGPMTSATTISGVLAIHVGALVFGHVVLSVWAAALHLEDASLVDVRSTSALPSLRVLVHIVKASVVLNLSGNQLLPSAEPVRGLVQWGHTGVGSSIQIAAVDTFVTVHTLTMSSTQGSGGPHFSLFSIHRDDHTTSSWGQKIGFDAERLIVSQMAIQSSSVSPQLSIALICFNASEPIGLEGYEGGLPMQRWSARGTGVEFSIRSSSLLLLDIDAAVLQFLGGTRAGFAQHWKAGCFITMVNTTLRIQRYVLSTPTYIRFAVLSAVGVRSLLTNATSPGGSPTRFVINVSDTVVWMSPTSGSGGGTTMAPELSSFSLVEWSNCIVESTAVLASNVHLRVWHPVQQAAAIEVGLNCTVSALVLTLGTQCRWLAVSISRSVMLLGDLRRAGAYPIIVTGVVVDAFSLVVDGNLSCHDIPRTTVQVVGKPVVLNRVVFDRCSTTTVAASCPSTLRWVRVNISVVCVAEAFLSVDASLDSEFVLRGVLNDQGPLLVARNLTGCSITVVSSSVVKLPTVVEQSAPPIQISYVESCTVQFGCLLPVLAIAELVDVIASGGLNPVVVSQVASCAPYGGCPLGPSFTGSPSLASTLSQSVNATLSVPSPSLSGSRSPSLSIATPSFSSQRKSPSITLSATRKLAFTPSDLFSSVDTVCPDAQVAADLSWIAVPVEFIQAYSLWIRFNVSVEYVADLFRTSDNLRFLSQVGDPSDVSPFIQRDVSAQSIWVRLGPVTHNPFESRSVSLQVGPDANVVSPTVGTIVVRISILQRDTTMPQEVTSTASTTTASLALLTANSVVAGSQARVYMLLSLTVCSYAADNSAYSFLGFGLGDADSDAFYYRGAVVGNSLLVVAVLAVGMCAIFFIAISSASSVSQFWRDAAFWATFHRLFGTLHVPGIAMVPLTLLLQPTLSSSIAVFAIGNGDAPDVLLGCVGVSLCLGAVGYVCITIVLRSPSSDLLHIGNRDVSFDSDLENDPIRDEPRHPSHLTPFTGVLKSWIIPSTHWVATDAAAKLWKRRHLHMFSDQATMWFTVFLLMGDSCIAIFNGMATVGHQSLCTFQLVVMLIIFMVQLALLIRYSPTLSCISHVGIIFATSCSAFCSALIIVSVLSSDQATRTLCIDAANSLATIISFAGLLQLLPMLFESVINLPRLLRRIWGARKTLERHRARHVGQSTAAINLTDCNPPNSGDDHKMLESPLLDDANVDDDVELQTVQEGSQQPGNYAESGAAQLEEEEDEEAPQQACGPSKEDYYYNENIGGSLGNRTLHETERVKGILLGASGVESIDFIRSMKSGPDIEL